ncbi:MAG: hypothetical protein ACJAQ6_000463 [Arenicella sp.]|jgi:hypothetical protein
MKIKATNQSIDNTFNRDSASLVNNTTIISNVELRDLDRTESTRADAYQSRGSFSFLAMKL